MSSGRVARNFLALASGDAVARVIAFGASIWVARVLGPGMYGVIGFATAVLLYCSHATECGLDLLGVRDVAEDEERARELAPALLTARLLVALALSILVGGAALLLLPDLEGLVLAFYTTTLFGLAASPKWIHLGFGDPRPVAVGRTAGELVFLGLVVLTVRRGMDLVAVPFAQATGDALAAALMLLWLRQKRGLRMALRFDWGAVQPVFARSWPLVANVLLGLTIYNSDLIFLRMFRDRQTVGWYSAAYQLISFLQNMATAFSLSLLPQLTKVLGHAAGRTDLYRSARAQVAAVALPVAVGGAFVAANLIHAVYGAAYRPSGGPLALLVLSVPFTLSKEVDLIALVASGRQRTVLRMTAWAVAVNLALNLALIPPFGILGAAAATAATEAARALFAALVTPRSEFPGAGWRRYGKSAAAASIMAAALWLVGPRGLPLQLAAGAGAYVLALSLLGGIRWRPRPRLSV